MSKENTEVNVEELTDAQLVELADKEAKEIAAKAEETTEEVVEEKPVVFTRKIDLGDGSGVQVFEAPTQDELIDKLVQAQTHATKKIREQSKEIKVEKTVEKAVEQELTADEEWLLSQEMQNHPSKTQKKLLEKTLGMTVEEFRSSAARIKAFERQQQEEIAANEFVQNNAEYYGCQANGERMKAYMNLHQLAPTAENLETAFKDLTKSGLLEAKPEEEVEEVKEEEVKEEEVSAESETANQQESRIAETQAKPVVTQRRVGSGLSSRGRAAAAVKSSEPTEEELYSMPMGKLAGLANRTGRG